MTAAQTRTREEKNTLEKRAKTFVNHRVNNKLAIVLSLMLDKVTRTAWLRVVHVQL